jgi:hypothetical protein
MDRIYSVLTVKMMDESDDKMLIEGMASTPVSDRVNDIVEPMGARFKTPMPLLWHHKREEPVGTVDFAQPTPQGIPFKASLPKISEPGLLKDRVDLAIHSIKYGLVLSVSIGIKKIPGGMEFLQNGGIHYKSYEWIELSLVTIGANDEAILYAIKSMDEQQRPAPGLTLSRAIETTPPGATGRKKPILLIPR